ncbi:MULTISPECIES: hypothetical protein, partial [unclassified Burkholderia]|uniref:hypothetical protein n=1 Tax=unclassified Burkholderia TaxID=2613784 RepID=UPI001C8AB91B
RDLRERTAEFADRGPRGRYDHYVRHFPFLQARTTRRIATGPVKKLRCTGQRAPLSVFRQSRCNT